MASINERIDFDCPNNLMLAIISLTALRLGHFCDGSQSSLRLPIQAACRPDDAGTSSRRGLRPGHGSTHRRAGTLAAPSACYQFGQVSSKFSRTFTIQTVFHTLIRLASLLMVRQKVPLGGRHGCLNKTEYQPWLPCRLTNQ